MNAWSGFKWLRISFSVHAAIFSPSYRLQTFQISDMCKLGLGGDPVLTISRPTSFPLKPQLSCGGCLFLEGLTYQEQNIAHKFIIMKKNAWITPLIFTAMEFSHFLDYILVSAVSSLRNIHLKLDKLSKKINLFCSVLFCVITQNCFLNVYSNVKSKFQNLVAT